MEHIDDFPLTRINNSLYMQFMDDVDSTIQRYTAATLKISTRYKEFQEKRVKLDAAYKLQMKNNLTVLLTDKDKERKDRLRCFLLHVEADKYNVDPEKRESSRLITNRIESYGDIIRASRRSATAKIKDAGKALQEEPLKSEVTKIGQTENVAAFVAANEEYRIMSLERSEDKKSAIKKAMLSARDEMDDVYRNIIMVINSQVTLKALMDAEEEEDPEEQYPSVQAEVSDNPLEDFVKSMNMLISEYRTEAEKTGSSADSDDNQTDTPSGEETDEEPEENPGEEQPTEPDDRPVVQ